ncbi:transcriptional regulatory protein RCO1 [Echria macrotheca]|uniref:Transcriptional regulatory protein RCO1 n=1 Tax=Echria macrotheca TaxID=438768 RepID=A0AAJ0BD22_9PEZI|nr:transcriptional regulatory protein RCO1 [Echria macrotheca]
MAPSSTRATRSRYSSPRETPNGTTEPSKGQAAASTPGAAAGGPQQQFMRTWLEPALNSKASFQDAGLQRHGVVENIQPLGTLPKAGLFKKPTTAAVTTPDKKVVPKRRILVIKRPVHEAPPTPVPEAAPAAREEDETEEEEDDGALDGNDYDDDGLHRRRSMQSRDETDEDWAGGKSSYRGYSQRSMSRTSGGRMGSVSSSSFQQGMTARLADFKEHIDKVVENAVEEALKHFRYPTAYALRTLYDEKCEEPDFLGLLDRIFRQTADQEDLDEFRRLMGPRKRDGKKGNKAYCYFIPPSTDSHSPLHEPKPAPYAHLLKLDTSTLHQSAEPESEHQRDTESLHEPEPEPEPVAEAELQEEQQPAAEPEEHIEPEPAPEPAPARAGKRGLSPEPDHQDDAEPEKEAHVRKKRRSNRHSAITSKMSPTAAQGKTKTVSPAKRRTRAGSHSSTSSLSSARSMTPPDGIRQDGDVDGDEAPPSRSSPAVRAASVRSTVAATKPAPRKGRRSLPARKSARASAAAERAGSKASTPGAATGSEEAGQGSEQEAADKPYDMPEAVDTFYTSNNVKKGKYGASGIAFPSKVGKLDPDDPKVRLRQSARTVTNSYQESLDESYSRESPVQEVAMTDRAASATPGGPAKTRNSLSAAARATPAGTNTRSTRSAQKRSFDDSEEQPSPTTVNFAASEAVPSTAANSRAGTPALRPAKKPRTGLRVKNSPMKKKGGTSAGIPRASGERSSPGALPKEDENDDYCASCGGNGELICCDGCTRSFHFNCVDPPLSRDSMPVEWFCHVCRSSRDTGALPTHSGALALVLEKLDGRNSSAFRLPLDVRDRFEGVKTGPYGDYEDAAAAVKPARKKKNDEEAVPDFFRLRDNDGNAIICHACQQSSSTNRAIIPCSVCGLWWHLDCLDPPLAIPPPLRTWKCPCHMDELLTKVPGTLAPAHRYRKIKNASVIQPAFSRGYVNNGYIEVDMQESEDESGWKDVETYGRTVRLPEKGIKLDFLARARSNRKGKAIPPLSSTSAPSTPTQPVLDKAELEKQQAAYTLAQLSGQGTSPGINSLIDVMLAEANPSVISLMACTDLGNLALNRSLNRIDKQGLRAMLAQLNSTASKIQRLLDPPTPEHLTPLLVPGSSGTTQEQAGRVPSLTHSQTDIDSEAPQPTPRVASLESSDNVREKNLPSPAASDEADVGSSMSDKALTPTRDPEDQLAGSSPADEKSTADKDDMPVTPTDSRMAGSNDAVIVKEPQMDKAAVEIEDDGIDLD